MATNTQGAVEGLARQGESLEDRIAKRASELAKDRDDLIARIEMQRGRIKSARESIKHDQKLLASLPKPPGTRKRAGKGKAAGASE